MAEGTRKKRDPLAGARQLAHGDPWRPFFSEPGNWPPEIARNSRKILRAKLGSAHLDNADRADDNTMEYVRWLRARDDASRLVHHIARTYRPEADIIRIRGTVVYERNPRPD